MNLSKTTDATEFNTLFPEDVEGLLCLFKDSCQELVDLQQQLEKKLINLNREVGAQNFQPRRTLAEIEKGIDGLFECLATVDSRISRVGQTSAKIGAHLQSLHVQKINLILDRSFQSQGLVENIKPVPRDHISTIEGRTLFERQKWWNMGLDAISEGKLAVLLLSGGQGTRLGSSDPKGCFDIGLPSRKSLFQLQAERILRIQRLASRSGTNFVQIPWYIMTSPFTDEAIRHFFESHKYFGLMDDQIIFFQQGVLPCISKNGKFIMETPYKVAKAPDGNGGVYFALESLGLLEDMSNRGVKYIDLYGVDNALVRVADPTFVGYFIDKDVSACAKVVKKAYPEEKVGVFVQKGNAGNISVVEYTELDPALSSSVNVETGELQFCWSNICLHMFTFEFLKKAARSMNEEAIFHKAEKTIASIEGPRTVGLKIEQFVFDSFTFCPATALFEVVREEEFAPVKNSDGSEFDTPFSARSLLLRLHANWVSAAGASISGPGVEVSPLCSYAGEDLHLLSLRKTYHGPCEITF